MDNFSGTDRYYFGCDLRSMGEPRRIESAVTIGTSADVGEIPFPRGYNPLCPTCRFLGDKYGPDDEDLFTHINADDYSGADDGYHYEIDNPRDRNVLDNSNTYYDYFTG